MVTGAGREVAMTEMGRVWSADSFDASTFGREYYFIYFYAYAKTSGTPLHARKNAPGDG